MPNDVALSFDGTEGQRAQPYLRRPTPHMQQQQGRPPTNNGPGLQFMNFDLASASGSSAPLGGHGSTYGGSSGSGYVSFEDEPPLLEGMKMLPLFLKIIF